MREKDIPNFVPYLFLVMVSAVLTTIAARRARNLKLVPLYLSISGTIYVFEYVILVLLESYIYQPHILHNPYFDNILGATVSDGFIVPSVGICIAVFDLSFSWISLIALLFVGIEESFVHLNIYHHVWWNTGYTFAGLVVCFELGKRIWHLLKEKYQYWWVQFIVLYLCNMVVQATTVFVLAAVFHLLRYQVDWFIDPIRGHVAVATLIVLLDSCVFTAVVVRQARFGWYAAVIIGVFLFNDGLMTIGRLQFVGPWAEVTVIFSQAVVLYILTFLRNLVALKADSYNTKCN